MPTRSRRTWQLGSQPPLFPHGQDKCHNPTAQSLGERSSRHRTHSLPAHGLTDRVHAHIHTPYPAARTCSEPVDRRETPWTVLSLSLFARSQGTSDLTQYEPDPAGMAISNKTDNTIWGLPSLGPDQTGGLSARLDRRLPQTHSTTPFVPSWDAGG